MRMGLLFEIGHGADEQTWFIFAIDEGAAIRKFIDLRGANFDGVEPGWENHIWAKDLTNRLIEV